MIIILTTSIHNKISGGTIFNTKLHEFLKKKTKTVSLEMIKNINNYNFNSETNYIVDGILIDKNINLARLKKYRINFLIHLWQSSNPNVVDMTGVLELEKSICENFTVFVTGENSCNSINDKLNSTKKKCHLIEPGIDPNWKTKKNYPELPKKIIYLANYIEGKGHFKLLSILKELNLHDNEIHCYGEILSEKYFSLLQNETLKLNLKNIFFKNAVAHNRVNDLLLEYDLLFHFSDYESYGMSIMEALATHLPILITPTGNFEKYQKIGIQGILNTFEKEEIKIKTKAILTSKKKYQEHILSTHNFESITWNTTFEALWSKIEMI